MLANEELPPRVVSNLRVISSLLSQQLDSKGALTDFNCLKRVAEDPLTGEVVPVVRKSDNFFPFCIDLKARR